MKHILVVAVLLAGCSGPSPTADPMDEPIMEGDPVRYETTQTEADGEIIGIDAYLVTVNPGGMLGQSSGFSFEVPKGSTEVRLVVDVEHALGQEADVVVWPGGCNSSSCQEFAMTNGGSLDALYTPEAGTWRVSFFPGEPGGGSFAWTATAHVTAPA